MVLQKGTKTAAHWSFLYEVEDNPQCLPKMALFPPLFIN
jgi:hypothetical protein